MKHAYLTVCIIGMCLLCVNIVNGKELIGVQNNVEERTIVPYPMPNPTPATILPLINIEKMPFNQDGYNKKDRPHFIPYIRLVPTPNGRGLGTEFGFKFGIFKSHGLGFGINLF